MRTNQSLASFRDPSPKHLIRLIKDATDGALDANRLVRALARACLLPSAERRSGKYDGRPVKSAGRLTRNIVKRRRCASRYNVRRGVRSTGNQIRRAILDSHFSSVCARVISASSRSASRFSTRRPTTRRGYIIISCSSFVFGASVIVVRVFRLSIVTLSWSVVNQSDNAGKWNGKFTNVMVLKEVLYHPSVYELNKSSCSKTRNSFSSFDFGLNRSYFNVCIPTWANSDNLIHLPDSRYQFNYTLIIV